MTRFDCKVIGDPSPEIYWFINKKQVRENTTHKLTTNDNETFSLVITNATQSDNGILTCVAKNKFGEISTQCRLTVSEREQVIAPKFIERFSNVTVNEGEPATLHVRAIGTPPPNVTWQKDGVTILQSDNIRIIDEGMGVSRFEIMKTKASDAGWYQCTAQNSAGSTTTKARLLVQSISVRSCEDFGTSQFVQMYPKPLGRSDRT